MGGRKRRKKNGGRSVGGKKRGRKENVKLDGL